MCGQCGCAMYPDSNPTHHCVPKPVYDRERTPDEQVDDLMTETENLRRFMNELNGTPGKSNDSSSYEPECGNDGEAFIKDSEGEYDMTGRPVRSEQEKFYKTVNHVVDDHATQISLGLAYGKYRFWKAIFTSTPGQIFIGVIL